MRVRAGPGSGPREGERPVPISEATVDEVCLLGHGHSTGGTRGGAGGEVYASSPHLKERIGLW